MADRARPFAVDADGGERLVFGDTPLHVHANEDEMFYAKASENYGITWLD